MKSRGLRVRAHCKRLLAPYLLLLLLSSSLLGMTQKGLPRVLPGAVLECRLLVCIPQSTVASLKLSRALTTIKTSSLTIRRHIPVRSPAQEGPQTNPRCWFKSGD